MNVAFDNTAAISQKQPPASIKPALILLLLALLMPSAFSATPDSSKQDLQEIRSSVEHYLTRESAGLPGKVTISVGNLDPRLNLASCSALEPFLPAGSRLWGKTSVGVRCIAPQPWVIYVTGNVKVWGTYYVSAKAISQGQTLTDSDISAIDGDLTTMASGVVTEPSQAVNHTSTMAISAGISLRQDSLRLQQVIMQGQTIRLISNGEGFKVSTEAQALNNASEGQLVKVKISSGQVLSGTAKFGGIVEVVN